MCSLEARALRSTTKVVSQPRTGLFGDSCIFCGKKKKKVKQQQQSLVQIETFEIQQSIVNEASELGDVNLRRKIHGVDLIAKEAKYHNWCRKTYANQADATKRATKEAETNERQRLINIRKEAFLSTVSYIKTHILEEEQVCPSLNRHLTISSSVISHVFIPFQVHRFKDVANHYFMLKVTLDSMGRS